MEVTLSSLISLGMCDESEIWQYLLYYMGGIQIQIINRNG